MTAFPWQWNFSFDAIDPVGAGRGTRLNLLRRARRHRRAMTKATSSRYRRLIGKCHQQWCRLDPIGIGGDTLRLVHDAAKLFVENETSVLATPPLMCDSSVVQRPSPAREVLPKATQDYSCSPFNPQIEDCFKSCAHLEKVTELTLKHVPPRHAAAPSASRC